MSSRQSSRARTGPRSKRRPAAAAAGEDAPGAEPQDHAAGADQGSDEDIVDAEVVDDEDKK